MDSFSTLCRIPTSENRDPQRVSTEVLPAASAVFPGMEQFVSMTRPVKASDTFTGVKYPIHSCLSVDLSNYLGVFGRLPPRVNDAPTTVVVGRPQNLAGLATESYRSPEVASLNDKIIAWWQLRTFPHARISWIRYGSWPGQPASACDPLPG